MGNVSTDSRAGRMTLPLFQIALQSLRTALGEQAPSKSWNELRMLIAQGRGSPLIEKVLQNISAVEMADAQLDVATVQSTIDKFLRVIAGRPIARTDAVAQNAFSWEKRTSVRQGRAQVSYKNLDSQGDAVAHFLNLTMDPSQERVALFLSRNRFHFFAITLGAKRVGASFTNFHSNLSGDEFLEHIQNEPYRVVFLDRESILKIEPSLPLLEARGITVVDLDDHYPSLIHYGELKIHFSRRPQAVDPDISSISYPGPTMFTSGTTGKPKLVLVPPTSRAGREANKLFRIGPEDRNLVIGQLFHAGALSWAMGHINRGAEVILTEHNNLILDPAMVVEAIKKHQVTNFWISPPWLQGLCRYLEQEPSPHDLSSLKAIYVGAAPFHPALKRRASKMFGPILWENYAMTEFGLIAVLKPEELLQHATTVGKPAPGVDIEIRDINNHPLSPGTTGQIFIRNELSRDIFVPSGDMGFVDGEGYLTMTSREVEQITIGGINVFPRAIETEFLEIEGIDDCHVMGISDGSGGHMVVAAVVAAVDHVFSEGELIDQIRERLGDSGKVPDRVVFLPVIPRKPYKVNSSILRELVIGRLATT